VKEIFEDVGDVVEGNNTFHFAFLIFVPFSLVFSCAYDGKKSVFGKEVTISQMGM
jgi:hypothetical protein